MDRDRLIELLKDLNSVQTRTDEDGGREVAWYYYRDQIEDVMGLDRGALDHREPDDAWAPESGTS